MTTHAFLQQYLEFFARLLDDFSLLYLFKKILMAGTTVAIALVFWRESGKRRRSRLIWTFLGLLCFYGVYLVSAFLALGIRFFLRKGGDERIISAAQAGGAVWLAGIFLVAFIVACLAVLLLKRRLTRRS